MRTALLVLGLVVGGLFASHGAQKLFDRFGGHGPEGAVAFGALAGLASLLPGRRQPAQRERHLREAA